MVNKPSSATLALCATFITAPAAAELPDDFAWQVNHLSQCVASQTDAVIEQVDKAKVFMLERQIGQLVYRVMVVKLYEDQQPSFVQELEIFRFPVSEVGTDTEYHGPDADYFVMAGEYQDYLGAGKPENFLDETAQGVCPLVG